MNSAKVEVGSNFGPNQSYMLLDLSAISEAIVVHVLQILGDQGTSFSSDLGVDLVRYIRSLEIL